LGEKFYIKILKNSAQCKIKEAIETLENTVKAEPWNMNDVFVHNLFLAYDFYYADPKERKRVIRVKTIDFRENSPFHPIGSY